MTVQVVTDSSSCLPKAMAEDAGIIVVDIYTTGQGAEKTTSGVGSLELAATYARLLERGNDAGVVALHLSKELSSTWSNAVTAAGIFDGKVRVLDTNSAGMVLGYAALKAARCAQLGGDPEEVAEVAGKVIESAKLWLYVHKLDSLRRGGRLSAGRSFLTTALAIKPIFQLSGGELHLAAKTRTQAKAMDKMVEFFRNEIVAVGRAAEESGSEPQPIRAAVHEAEAKETAVQLQERLEELVVELHSQLEVQLETEAVDEASGEHGKESRDGKDHKGARDKKAAEHLPAQLPEVIVDLVEISPAMAVHTGPGAVGLVTTLY